MGAWDQTDRYGHPVNVGDVVFVIDQEKFGEIHEIQAKWVDPIYIECPDRGSFLNICRSKNDIRLATKSETVIYKFENAI